MVKELTEAKVVVVKLNITKEVIYNMLQYLYCS